MDKFNREDCIAIGHPTHLGGVSWKMKKWWDERTPDIWFKTDGKFTVPVTSAGRPGGDGAMDGSSMSPTFNIDRIVAILSAFDAQKPRFPQVMQAP
jgi:multimeric flavodoxin WrbA